MCGLAGFIKPSPISESDGAILSDMSSAITHRGPDDAGIWMDAAAGVGLAHRRLSIVDISEAGHQPMLSPSERFVIVFNGEIYNFQDLRRELESQHNIFHWRGHSDTEVLLAAIDCWGVPATLKRLNGMFAFALWDRSTRTLTLARDRLGKKPLYYGRMNGVLLFGSELKSLCRHPAFSASVDRSSLRQLLQYDYIQAPRSIWQGISKLLPGHYIEIHDGGRNIGQPIGYWHLHEDLEAGLEAKREDPEVYLKTFEALLKDAVLRRMEADVSIGAFLSGGVDSSLVVALMQAQSAKPVRTFTIGFHEPKFNEAHYAKAIADHLGTDHTELYVTERDALDLIPRLPHIWDEPLGDSSQIPTFMVSEMTRRHVKVSLSGDGGDELFGGYSRYQSVMRIWNTMALMPNAGKKPLARLLNWAGATGASLDGRSHSQWHDNLREDLSRAAAMLNTESKEGLYDWFVSRTTSPEKFVLGDGENIRPFMMDTPSIESFQNKMMYLDTLSYLPDDVLAKVDRASMASSLEVRCPLLDHRVVRFSWSLPISAKISGSRGKHILRSLLNLYVPSSLIERPKMGFGLPMEKWLKGALRDWAEDLLSEHRLRMEGHFDAAEVRQLWHEYLSGYRRRHRLLWNILSFQAWWAAQESRLKKH